VSFSSSASYDGASTHWVDTVDGVATEYVGNYLGDMHYEYFPFNTNDWQQLPNFIGMPGVHHWRFCFYSNNLLAILRSKPDNTARFESLITLAEAVAHDAPSPQDQRHYGSFNPITAEFVVGSLVPVNWA
jgi:hypothetical protein